MDHKHLDLTRRRRSLRVPMIGMLLVVLALAAAGCGSSKSSSPSGSAAGGSAGGATTSHVALAKTKFVLHAGLAFGAFHRYVYKPVKAGDLAHPLTHKLALVKAGLASAFVYHELKLALHDAQSSPTLSKLVSPITALQAKISGLGSGVKHGQVDPGQLSQADGSISSIKQQSSSAGSPIMEQTPAHF
ncbi:MAG: hypothetical protein ACR2IP_00790 [Solirubrobacteraceae bacterium]